MELGMQKMDVQPLKLSRPSYVVRELKCNQQLVKTCTNLANEERHVVGTLPGLAGLPGCFFGAVLLQSLPSVPMVEGV